MRHIYLDNAATSFPKPEGVAERMLYYLGEVGANINRSAYESAGDAGKVMLELRIKLGQLFNHANLPHIVITPGATAALNMAIKGALRAGDHCVADPLAHNAVMRPLRQLEQKGVELSAPPCDEAGRVNASDILPLLRPNTRLIVITHASNVTGSIAPLEDIAQIARAHNIPLVVDAAQSAGHLPVDFTGLGLSALAVPAHKGLLGPEGIGALLLEPGFAAGLEPLVTGGTGSASDSEYPPELMPDKFESGTINLPGVYGFECALDYVLRHGVLNLREHEMRLAMLLIEGLQHVPGVRVVGPMDRAERVGVVSVDFHGRDNALVASKLAEEFGVCTRVGLHCSPAAHKAIGTFPTGTVRFTIGWGNTRSDIDIALDAVKRLVRRTI